MSVVKRFLDPTKRPCNYPHLCSADDPYYRGDSLFTYWLDNIPAPSYSAIQARNNYEYLTGQSYPSVSKSANKEKI